MLRIGLSKGTLRIVILIAILSVALFQSSVASAVVATSPFDAAHTSREDIPDQMGTGVAQSAASATTGGSLFAQVTATANSTVGAIAYNPYVVYAKAGVGGSEASAYARVYQTLLGIPTGSHTVVVTFKNVSSFVALSPQSTSISTIGVTGAGTGFSDAYVVAAFHLYACNLDGECTFLAFAQSSFAFTGSGGAATLDVTADVITALPNVLVIAYLQTTVRATGSNSSARATISGTVDSISVS